MHLEQRMVADELADLGLERTGLAVEQPQLRQAAPSEGHLDAVLASQQEAGTLAVAERDEVGDRGAVPGDDDHQIGMEPVPDAHGFGDGVLAGLDEHPDVDGPIRQPDRWQGSLPGRDPGDRKRVAGIALARAASGLALGASAVVAPRGPWHRRRAGSGPLRRRTSRCPRCRSWDPRPSPGSRPGGPRGPADRSQRSVARGDLRAHRPRTPPGCPCGYRSRPPSSSTSEIGRYDGRGPARADVR